MILELDWIVKEPIDFEYKQYVLLDYLSKINNEFDMLRLYPAFQELSLHLANVTSIIEKESYITLNRDVDDIDDEVLLADLKYNKIEFKTIEDRNEIMMVAEQSKDRLRDLFIVGKAMWSLIYDSVLVKPIDNVNSKGLSSGLGYFYFTYDDIFNLYEYTILKINDRFDENKCNLSQIYSGKKKNIIEIIDEDLVTKEKLPIFEIIFNSNFPIEGSLLSLTKRKIMNYILQTVKIDKIRTGA